MEIIILKNDEARNHVQIVINQMVTIVGTNIDYRFTYRFTELGGHVATVRRYDGGESTVLTSSTADAITAWEQLAGAAAGASAGAVIIGVAAYCSKMFKSDDPASFLAAAPGVV